MSLTIETVSQSGRSNWVHRLALLIASATVPLLFIGGLVTSKGVGLAVPDWPTTFGHNMFLYPWSEMVGGIFYEHGHRLFASGVGLLTVLLALALWGLEPRRWVRWLGTLALFSVVGQGILGGLRVVLLEQTLAIIHGCLAQAFFALLVSLALFTSKEWEGRPRKVRVLEAGRLRRLSLLTTGFIYLQVVFGAVLRYTGTLVEGHLLVALLVAVHVFLLASRIRNLPNPEPKLWGPMLFLGILLILQLGLGLGSFIGKFAPLGLAVPPMAVVVLTTTHLVVGALMLATSLVLTLRSFRLLGLPEPLSNQGLVSVAAQGKTGEVSA